MFNIITAVISIALMSLFLTAGISYYNPNAFDKLIIGNQLSSYMVKLNGAVSTYQIYNDSLPTKISDISPTFINSINATESMSLLEINNVNGLIVSCIGGEINESELDALIAFKENKIDNSIIIGKECSDTANADFEPIFPQTAVMILKHH